MNQQYLIITGVALRAFLPKSLTSPVMFEIDTTMLVLPTVFKPRSNALARRLPKAQ